MRKYIRTSQYFKYRIYRKMVFLHEVTVLTQTYVDGIDKDNVVCNKNIEIGGHLRVCFLIEIDICIYIYNQKSTQHIDICNKYMYICTHIEIYIGTGLEYKSTGTY